MKVLKCSECWLPRDKGATHCKKCIKDKQSQAFVDALNYLFQKKELDITSLINSLSSKDLTQLFFYGLVKSHPIAKSLSEKKELFWSDVLYEIRSHTKPHSNTCAAFRVLLQKGLYNEIVIPEECCECMYTAVTQNYSAYSNLAIGHLFYSDKEKTISLFKKHLQTKGARESLLNYINFMFWISNSEEFMTPTASRRVIDCLLEANEKSKEWILEQLVLRPENYRFFLATPSLLPGNYDETMFGVFETFEVWWNWWQRINTTARKKIEFRSQAFTWELLAVTWHETRVREWCLDIEMLSDINRYFTRRIGK